MKRAPLEPAAGVGYVQMEREWARFEEGDTAIYEGLLTSHQAIIEVLDAAGVPVTEPLSERVRLAVAGFIPASVPAGSGV